MGKNRITVAKNTIPPILGINHGKCHGWLLNLSFNFSFNLLRQLINIFATSLAISG
jgi:hypothetical protein